jgi:SpoVK/Ycf46/Vps4 family AAA+-type ATPase
MHPPIDNTYLKLNQLRQKIDNCQSLEEMLSCLKEAKILLAENLKNHTSFAIIAKIYHLLGDNKTANKFFCEAEQRDKGNKEYTTWVFITSLLAENKDLKILRDTVFSIDTKTSKLALGEYYYSLKQYDEALTIADSLYRSEPASFDYAYLYIRCLDVCNKDAYEIVHVLQNNQLLHESDAGAIIMLKSLDRSGEKNKCESQCKKIIARKPNTDIAQLAQEILTKYRKQQISYRKKNLNIADDDNDINHSSTSLEDALRKLNNLIGLVPVKKQVGKTIKTIEYNRVRKVKLNLQGDELVSYHFVFTGNPGTGKTTVARLLCDILYYLGILEKGQLIETDRSGLVGQYVGETAQKTQKLIEKAIGGILFVDEAYSLYNGTPNSNDYGAEALETLLKSMEDNRGRFIVVFAGYKDEMNKLLQSNPGLLSRFNKFIEFPDYSDKELMEIADQIAYKSHYYISEDGKKAFQQRISREQVDEKFGNARTVRNIVNEAIEEKASISIPESLSKEDFLTLTARDFGIDAEILPEERASKYLNEMNNLIGLSPIKKEITSIIKIIKYYNDDTNLLGGGWEPINMHMLFTGNPGTGKTTVARLFAGILKGTGVLKKGHLIEATRADLVGQWLGQTAKLTKEKCHMAYGGILFIDEAYSLCNGLNDAYGKEAVDTLIKEMEDNRDKLVVILAGYTTNMQEFLQTNPGLTSRISKNITFPDYTPDEMLQIFLKFSKDEQLIVAEECIKPLSFIFHKMYSERNERFGNGRDVRKLFEEIKTNMICRVQDQDLEGIHRKRIIGKDVFLTENKLGGMS